METKRLIKIALLTSPIIGVYSIFPLFLFLDSISILNTNIEFNNMNKVLIGSIIIMGIVFLQWVFNIFLFRILQPLDFFKNKRALIYISSYIFIILSILFIDTYRDEALAKIDVNFIRIYPFINGVAFNTFILFIIALVSSQNKRINLEVEKATLEVENVTARHEQLKHKIQPHFLFNALNTLKILIHRKPKDAEKYLVNLSSLLRSSIIDTEKDVSTIKEELKICNTYLELQRVRFKDAIYLNVDVPDDISERFYLPVFTLQTLVENAVQHNAFTKDNPLNIDIIYADNKTIVVCNTIIPKFNPVRSTGTGLRNLSKRFKLLSDQKLTIVEKNDMNQFEVSFKIIK